MTAEDYKNLVGKQNNKCAIKGCKNKKPKFQNRRRHLYVDHCHSTGKIRGLLCSKHNTALGYVNDSPKELQGLIEYLLAAGVIDDRKNIHKDTKRTQRRNQATAKRTGDRL
jgi:hypothetical protein